MPTGSLSTAALGMTAQQRMVDNIANNLANVSTTGFKRSRIAFQDLFYQNIATSKRGGGARDVTNGSTSLQIGHGARPVATIRNFTQGPIQETGNPLDMAINGEGFFQIELPDGNIAYTRDGSFTLNANGTLVNTSGLPLADQISIPEDAEAVSISKDGVITARLSGSGVEIDLGQIELAKFINPAGLTAMGDNLYGETEASGMPFIGIPGTEGFGMVQQTYLEESNVDVVTEMVQLIEAQRAYEINSKMVQTAEEMMSMTNALKR